MVKHVYYKKQATGSTWHLLSKMASKATSEAVLEKKRKRNHERSQQVRQERLMTAYINIRHPLIHKEAKEYYNKLNRLYPGKRDLIKTPRFQELKQSKITDNMELRIPLHNQLKPVETLSRQATQQIPPTELNAQDTLSTVELNQQVIDQATQQIPPTELNAQDTLSTVELNQQVIDQATQQIPPTELNAQDTLSTVELNEQVIDHIPADDLEDITPSIDEIPPALVQTIIKELRADPNLKALMDDVETRMDNEDEDIDIDIEIVDNLLEKELLFW